jgi:predicted Holliday junction resolvase-like endonuclease
MEHAVIGFLSALVLAWTVYYFLLLPRHVRQLHEFQVQRDLTLKQSASKSRSTIKGQIAEQMYPILPGCPYLLSDMRFIGMPIDFIIFKGYTNAKDENGDIEEIIFADVKQGTSRLSPHQKKIKDAIEAGKVRWETIQITSDFEVR